MKLKMLLLALVATLINGSPVHAQEPAADYYTQRLTYVDTLPGKNQEWRQLIRDTSLKTAQMQADSGEIISWTLLRSVYPAGQEARSDYLISVISAGRPRSSERSFAENLELAGVEMSTYELFDKRRDLSTLVAAELWRPRIYNGAAQNGNYLTLNLMDVHDWDKIGETTSMWSPLSKEWIKQGAMTGWIFASKLMPSGAETPYTAYSANMYPSFEAAFAPLNVSEVVAKVHPGKDWDDFRKELPKARTIARREVWRVVERITKTE